MSRQLIAHSPDLLKLQNEGYDIEVRGGYLLIKDVPYVNSNREVKLGTLISPLKISGEITDVPDTHVAYWTGEHPCHSNGAKIESIANPSGAQDFGNDIQADFTFSAKAEYRDYHHKMTTYIGRITGEAKVLAPNATAETYPVLASKEAESPFLYIDTATSRVGIGNYNERFEGHRIGIVGVGGTGSYVLDLIAKTCVKEIYLFDDDVFSQHNAFRAPGAASIDDLKAKKSKVDYFANIYGKMRRGIHVNGRLDSNNANALTGLDFVFLCMDTGAAKKAVVHKLLELSIPFIEVGMGLVRGENGLSGLMRVTTAKVSNQEHILSKMNFSDENAPENEYSTNIQIVELNALNASLAVIAWKKHYGFYRDSSHADAYSYSIAANEMVNEELA